MWRKKLCDGSGCALLFLVICVGFIVVVYLRNEEEDPGVQAFVKQGVLKGFHITTRKGRRILGFQRIPYALPPIGDLRFRVRRLVFNSLSLLVSCFLLCRCPATLTEVPCDSPQDTTAKTARTTYGETLPTDFTVGFHLSHAYCMHCPVLLTHYYFDFFFLDK
jgi:hypothetical protein